jgi:hypothetical protein
MRWTLDVVLGHGYGERHLATKTLAQLRFMGGTFVSKGTYSRRSWHASPWPVHLRFSGDSVQRNDGVDDMFSADLSKGRSGADVPSAARPLPHTHVSTVFGDYAGMPLLLLISGSPELLLDDSVRVSQPCPSARLLLWDDMPHVLPGFAFLPEACEAMQRIGPFVRECVAGGPEPQAAAEGDVDRTASTEPATPAEKRLLQRFGVGAMLYFAMAVVTGLLSLTLLAGWLHRY